jgi:hypothetical protein
MCSTVLQRERGYSCPLELDDDGGWSALKMVLSMFYQLILFGAIFLFSGVRDTFELLDFAMDLCAQYSRAP